MGRLYVQIYLGFVGIVVLFAVATVALRVLEAEERPGRELLLAAAGSIGNGMPPPGAPAEQLHRALRDAADHYDVSVTLWTPDRELLASAGPPLPPPPPDAAGPVAIERRHGPPGMALRLADGRWLGVSPRPSFPLHHGRGPGVTALALLAAAIAVGAWPVSRRIARRLERLRRAAEELGAGDLSARVPVEGSGEVADVARSFNRAAERIEKLVLAQRRVLASASHELRSPLTRLRVAVELMDEPGARLRTEAEKDIAELDALIEDLLLSARLESGEPSPRAEPVALAPILAEEAERVGARVEGDAGEIRGDPRLLRRLVRNLLENARRHAGGGDVEVRSERLPGGGVRLRVADRGPGVPASERERIFEPFYRPAGHSEGRDGGVGLGLALVREIARCHGGDACCRARPGGGTVFEVELPNR